VVASIANTQVDDALLELVETLQDMDETNPLAALNEKSISDNNGGRILL